MNAKNLGLLGLMAVGLVLLACDTTTTVLPSGQQIPAITVSGTGSVFGEPDVAVLTLGVEAEAETVGEARAQAGEAMEALLSALKAGGVAEDDIQTTRFSVQPRYDFTERRQELLGFVVANLVTAKIRNIDDTGELIDAALEAGGDLTRAQNLQFTIDDPSALEDQAREEAIEEARHKAETLAEAADVALGPPRSISESGGARPIAFAGASLARIEDAGTPIEAGELEVRVQVQMVFDLEQR
jgi:hypothetical protein